MLVVALSSGVIVLAMLLIAVLIVEYVQLVQPADCYPTLVALTIAALVVGFERQTIVAVVDIVAVAMVGPMQHVLVRVLLALPWDQVAWQLGLVPVADALVVP